MDSFCLHREDKMGNKRQNKSNELQRRKCPAGFKRKRSALKEELKARINRVQLLAGAAAREVLRLPGSHVPELPRLTQHLCRSLVRSVVA